MFLFEGIICAVKHAARAGVPNGGEGEGMSEYGRPMFGELVRASVKCCARPRL